MTRSRIALFLAVVLATSTALAGITHLDQPAPANAAAAPAGVVVTYGVGGVLKSDGRLYQWRPERRQWVTIDESFRLDGETRSILPLPVVASEVARMEGFGFIVTRAGHCWLYNLDSNKWENIGRP
jgi:hypothetical protein